MSTFHLLVAHWIQCPSPYRRALPRTCSCVHSCSLSTIACPLQHVHYSMSTTACPLETIGMFAAWMALSRCVSMSAGTAQLVGDLLTRQIAPADVNLTGSIPADFFEPLEDLQVLLVDGNPVSSSKLFCSTVVTIDSCMFVRVQG